MKDQQTFVGDMLEHFNRMYNNGDVSAAADVFAPDFVRIDPSNEEVRGPEGAAQYILDLRTQYPDILITFREHVFDEDKMAVHWHLQGTDLGTHARSKLEATGKEVDFRGTDVLRFEGDKIVEDHVYYDQLEVFQQLGLIPAELF